MPALVNVGGAGSNSVYSDLMDPTLFLSLASGYDLCCPSRKRSRVNAPYIFSGGRRLAAFAEVVKPPQQQQKRCSLDALPDECLFEIFRRLAGPQERSLSACVSKRWLSLLTTIRASDLTKNTPTRFVPDLNETEPEDAEVEADCDGHLTRTLDSTEATDIRLAAVAVGTAGRGGLGKLSIRGSHRVTDHGLSAVARCCGSLRALALWKVPNVTDAGLAEIAAGCPLLEKLDIRDCPLITDKGLIAVAKNCPNLSALTIEACQGINNDGLQAIGRSCSKLQSLSVKNCPLVGDAGIAGLVSAPSSSLRKIMLHNLNITDASLAVIGYYGKSVTDLVLSDIRSVAERGFWVMGNTLGMQKLKSLFLTSCSGVTDVGLQAIGKGCPSLRQLCLNRCGDLSDAGLKAFVEAATALESLQLEECSRITLVGVLAGLLNSNTKLKTLALVKCLGIKDIGFQPAQIPLCMSLCSLTVRDCPGFTSRSLAFVGKICPQLQQIDLSGLVGITDAGLLPLIENAQSGLVKVSLNGCANLTDAIVFSLAKVHGKTLRLLHLSGCKNVSDKSLLAISGGCSVLEDLDLSKGAITDYGVALLASARQFDLKMLALGGCAKLTEKCLPFLGNMGKSLSGLSLQRCKLISDLGVSLLETKLWWCDILS